MDAPNLSNVCQLHARPWEWRANPDIRKTLEGYAYQYLTVVSPDRRFCQPGFGDYYIAGSAREIPDFSPVKAAKAFDLIEGVVFRPRDVKLTTQAS